MMSHHIITMGFFFGTLFSSIRANGQNSTNQQHIVMTFLDPVSSKRVVSSLVVHGYVPS